MNPNLLSPAIFYLSVLTYVICLYRKGGIKIGFNNFETLKYQIGTSLFFFVNINVLFFCSLCHHCHSVCIPFTMSSVSIGLVVYLTHLGKQTVKAIKQIIAEEEFDLMAPFFSVPYFFLIYDIIKAISGSGFASLHTYESKMLIVLLYPFFLAIGELTCKIKKVKANSDDK